jgi:hypothetical protein
MGSSQRLTRSMQMPREPYTRCTLGNQRSCTMESGQPRVATAEDSWEEAMTYPQSMPRMYAVMAAAPAIQRINWTKKETLFSNSRVSAKGSPLSLNRKTHPMGRDGCQKAAPGSSV